MDCKVEIQMNKFKFVLLDSTKLQLPTTLLNQVIHEVSFS